MSTDSYQRLVPRSFVYGNYIENYLKIKQKEMRKELEEMFDKEPPDEDKINKIFEEIKKYNKERENA